MPGEPKPRFLAPLGKPRDYVDKPELSVRDEPECVGPAILESYRESARFYESLQHQKAVELARLTRPLLATEDRLRDLDRRAKAARCDLSHELHIMRRDLDRARAGNRREPRRVHDRLERLEHLMDGLDGDGFPFAA